MVILPFLRTATAFAANRAGNLGMIAAVTLPVLLAAVGVALDYMSMVNKQRVLQNGLDAAAVSAAASLAAGSRNETNVSDYAAALLIASIGDSLSEAEKSDLKSKFSIDVKKTTSGGNKTYDVKLSSDFTVILSPFSHFAGYSRRPVAAVSSTQSEYNSKNAISMYLVLDRSGSMSFVTDTVDSSRASCANYTMTNWPNYPYVQPTSPCYVNKMAALKQAAAALFTEFDVLERKDPNDTIIRVGGVSFTEVMQAPQSVAWGTSSLITYVGNLPSYPTGGTDMTEGMDLAYRTLTDTAETAAQATKGNTVFSKFIVLMTDGENTGASTIWNPELDAKTLATCTAARTAGITIYAVAFMAPPNGAALLENCAGSIGNFYAANNMKSLVDAFSDIGNKAAEKATRIIN